MDESDVADRRVAAATELASLSHGEVFVLHLREREPTKFGIAPSLETPADARSLVDDAVDKLTAAGVKAAGTARESVFGYAAKEIIAEGEKRDAGLIVMGSQGRGDLAGMLLGSTAHKVIHLAGKPVLVIR